MRELTSFQHETLLLSIKINKSGLFTCLTFIYWKDTSQELFRFFILPDVPFRLQIFNQKVSFKIVTENKLHVYLVPPTFEVKRKSHQTCLNVVIPTTFFSQSLGLKIFFIYSFICWENYPKLHVFAQFLSLTCLEWLLMWRICQFTE